MNSAFSQYSTPHKTVTDSVSFVAPVWVGQMTMLSFLLVYNI